MDMDLSLAEKYFQISTKGSDEAIYSLPAKEALEPARMREMLELGTKLVKGVGNELSVSFIGSGVYGLVATKQFVMSHYDRILDLSLGNIELQIESHDDHAHLIFKVGEWRWTDLPEEGRDAAVEAEWVRYFKEDINPIVEAASLAGGLKPDIIWNQYGSRAASVLDFLRGMIPAGPLLESFEADSDLLNGLPGTTFNRKKNPFKHEPKYIYNPYSPETPLMVRSACCMYYRRECGEKCYSCPILKESDREKIRKNIEQERESQTA